MTDRVADTDRSVPGDPRPGVTVIPTSDDLARQHLRAALLRHELVIDALLALDKLRDDRLRYYRCVTLTAGALRVFSRSELDYFVSVIDERRQNGTWALSIPVGGSSARKHSEPVGAVTIARAAEALARRLDAARSGVREPTDLDLADEQCVSWAAVRKAVSRLTSGSDIPEHPVSERTRRRVAVKQRQIAQLERERLDARVAEGTLYRWTHADFERLTDELGLEAIDDPEFAVYTEPPGPWSDTGGGGAAATGRGIFTGTVHAVNRMNGDRGDDGDDCDS